MSASTREGASGAGRRESASKTVPSRVSVSTNAPCGVKTGVSWIMDRVLYAGMRTRKTIGADLTGFARRCAVSHSPLKAALLRADALSPAGAHQLMARNWRATIMGKVK